jgi:hypothetical protein
LVAREWNWKTKSIKKKPKKINQVNWYQPLKFQLESWDQKNHIKSQSKEIMKSNCLSTQCW